LNIKGVLTQKAGPLRVKRDKKKTKQQTTTTKIRRAKKKREERREKREESSWQAEPVSVRVRPVSVTIWHQA
jgi:hypothetical protein